MRTLTTDVLVIGGGATGAGVLRDLALRGIRCALVEKGDLTHGTTGRYHGLLHSGGRYVVKDPQSAEECARENEILRRIMPHCIEETGGLFVVTPADDEAFADQFVAACRRTGVWVEEIPVREALQREPLLNPRIRRAFAVRDGAADSFLATHANADDARRYGAQVLTYHRVVELERTADRIIGAVCEDLRSGETVRIHASFIINATGAWAGKIAALAGLRISVVPGKGTMIAMNHRIVNTVVNRCKMPADGDIIVPIHTVAVLGTTDIPVPDPDVYDITPEEVDLILEEGEWLVPGVSHMRTLRAWAGVRPLYKENDAGSDRDIPRTRTRSNRKSYVVVCDNFDHIPFSRHGTFARRFAHTLILSKPPSCRDMPIIGFWYNNARTSLINNQRSGAIQRATMTVWSHIDTPGGRTSEDAHQYTRYACVRRA
jgi:glycerol-3-phosphate dehydrogenase